MLNKIATVFGVLIAVAVGILIAPYFSQITTNLWGENADTQDNVSADQAPQQEIYSAPVNDTPPDGKDDRVDVSPGSKKPL